MTHRVYKAIALGCFAVAVLTASSANAAISVIGSGIAEDCYKAAEFGGSPMEGITTCTYAIDETALTNSDKAATYINRGILEARNNNPHAALEDYNRGLKLNGALGEGYVDRGASEIVLKDLDHALADINQGISLHANRLEIAYYDRAIVDEAQGNIRAAYEDYKMAVQLAPDFGLANEQLMRFKVVRKSNASGA